MPARAALLMTLPLLAALVPTGAAAPATRPTPAGTAQHPNPLKRYDSRYYIIHTDLTGDDLREADLRMTRMAEEYKRRCAGFSGDIRQKFPFFLFRNPRDYYAAGARAGTAGVFDAQTNTLMAIAGSRTTNYTWNTIQHEGFHQFARNVIGGELPIWVNEGLAEYFGEGIFTGDGFVTGHVPPQRLVTIKKQIEGGEFKSIKDMMLLTHARWNEEMKLENYDQAWTMVHFLAHAEEGKYQAALVNFMRAISTGQKWDAAWLKHFGSAEGFETKWRNYWLTLPDDPTADLLARATTETITGALARAVAKKQKFETFDALLAAAKSNALQQDDRDWIPPKLVAAAFARAEKMQAGGAKFELLPGQNARLPIVLCTTADGSRVTGKFSLNGVRVAKVTTESPTRR